jgi:Zn-dependent protease with chaperone function
MLLVSSLFFSLLTQDAHAEGILDRIRNLIIKAVNLNQSETNFQKKNNETLEPSSDRLCDSLDHSYTLTESLTELGVDEVWCKFMKCQQSEMVIPSDEKKLGTWLYNYSMKHVWLPVSFESEIGLYLLGSMQDQGAILERGSPITDRLYARVELALEAAKKSYPSAPYELKVFIVDITDQVNAQAAPGGNIFITRAAAKDLDDDALGLVLGHEVAHLAKRHMSKQLQQRLLETADGLEIFKRLLIQKFDIKQQTTITTGIFNRLKCSFAQYDQDQESQADACAVRVMIEAGGDPIVAWDNFVRVRGTIATAPKPKTQSSANSACFASLGSHPQDRERSNNIKSATHHHRANPHT